MALTNYATLQTALANTLHRSDLTSAIPDFITLCEDKLNKRLRLRAMETRVTASINSEYLSLPTGFLAMQDFHLNTTPRTALEYVTSDFLDERYPGGIATDTPKFFTFIGGEIQLAPVPDTTYEAEIDYYKKFDLATDTTNWLLTNAPRAYYYGSLVEAAIYMKDEKRAMFYQSFLDNTLRELEFADDTDRIPDGGLSVKSLSAP